MLLSALIGPVLFAALPVDGGPIGQTCAPQWQAEFGSQEGLSGTVFDMAVFDDGNGPALYAVGAFGSAGGSVVEGLARWDGGSWTAVGGGGSVAANSLAVFDDGSGPALYVGGGFNSIGGISASHVARWDGASWSALAEGVSGFFSNVRALGVHDDGSGPALYVGGTFTTAGTQPARNVARWDGSSWSPLAEGVSGASEVVFAFESFDDGSGEALFVGGSFTAAGTAPAAGVARWKAGAWTPLGSGVGGDVRTLETFDDGTGPFLYAGGFFTGAGATAAKRIARWNGQAWSDIGFDRGGFVNDLVVHDDGSGTALYVGGSFTSAGPTSAKRVARWDGSAWSTLGEGLGNEAEALAVFDEGSGPALFAGGSFITAGGESAKRVARWDGGDWSALGNGFGGATTPNVEALAIYNDGSGPELVAAGAFTTVDDVVVNRIARWDGETWSPFGAGMNNTVQALAVFDDGTGPRVFAGGKFFEVGGLALQGVARWTGQNWNQLGGGINGDVRAMAVFDDGAGPALYVGGTLTIAGGQPASLVAKWTGTTWQPLGSGIECQGCSFVIPGVTSMVVHDDGTGPALYVGGTFDTAGGLPASNIARWDGSAWSALGAGASGGVQALATFDDGSGEALFAGGAFFSAGGGVSGTSRIAKWSGSNWSSLGSGANNDIGALATFDDGTGAALYAGGAFTSIDGQPADRIARWNGSQWSALGVGLSGRVRALAPAIGLPGPALYVGGDFTISPAGDSRLAAWGGCELPGALSPLDGCFPAFAYLFAEGESLALGTTLTIQLLDTVYSNGAAILFVGFDATIGGCGAFFPGLGELLVNLPGGPLPVAQATTAGGSATFSVPVPPSPSLVGATLAFQAANVAVALPLWPSELSRALVGTVAP